MPDDVQKLCDTCGEPAEFKLTLTSLEGVLLDWQLVCRKCLEEQATGLEP